MTAGKRKIKPQHRHRIWLEVKDKETHQDRELLFLSAYNSGWNKAFKTKNKKFADAIKELSVNGLIETDRLIDALDLLDLFKEKKDE